MANHVVRYRAWATNLAMGPGAGSLIDTWIGVSTASIDQALAAFGFTKVGPNAVTQEGATNHAICDLTYACAGMPIPDSHARDFLAHFFVSHFNQVLSTLVQEIPSGTP